MMTEENKDQKVSKEEEKENNQPELTGEEETVKKEAADYKENKVDEKDTDVKSPLNGNKAE